MSIASNVRTARASLVDASRRYTRVAHEAEDLAHDILLSAIRRGALEGESFLLRVHGAARQHAAYVARTAARRRAREAHVAHAQVPEAPPEHTESEGAPLSVLSPALRTTLLLLLAGLEKAELRYALGVSDAALRKRFQALRDHAPLMRPEPSEGPTAPPALRRSQVGVLPQLAGKRASANPAARVLATSDPDGHGIIFAEMLTRRPGTATPEEPALEPRVTSKGTPC